MNSATPAPLPIPVRPETGEHYTSYLRRLAEANHLQPSLLRAYVNDKARCAESFSLARLAAVSGRSAEALRRALTGATPALIESTKPRRRRQGGYIRRKLPLGPATRLLEDLRLAAEEVRYENETALFTAIRTDALVFGSKRHELAHKYFLSERMIRAILGGVRQPRPPGRTTAPKEAPTIEPVRALIVEMWQQGMAADRIWSELVDVHHSAISKPTLQYYLRQLRHHVGRGMQ